MWRAARQIITCDSIPISESRGFRPGVRLAGPRAVIRTYLISTMLRDNWPWSVVST